MKIRLSLVHLIILAAALAQGSLAQVDLPQAQIVTLNLDPHDITVLHLRRGYVSSVRLPEEVSSVVLGDPAAFKAEHSDAEPQLVFFKPTSPKPAETNALITTRTGHEVSLSLVSEGSSSRAGAVDYVLEYERPHSFLIGAVQSSFVVGETKAITPDSQPTINTTSKVESEERQLLGRHRLEAPRWEGKQLRVAVGQTQERGEEMTVAFSVLNSSSRTIELLPPQIQLAGTSHKKHGKAVRAEPVAIKEYRMTARRLDPGDRADGAVIFERPAFKESRDRLLLQIAQAEEVDRPVLARIAFVAPATRETK
jgi:hypothetical protein